MGAVPVFVSSTFRDFHAERDVIHSRVRPLLDAAVAEFGCRVEVVDLRWGVATEDLDEPERQQRVLDVCLREIDRARPLFVGLLGDRFGWVPSTLRGEAALRAAGIDPAAVPTVPHGRWSITALEVWHGALTARADAVLVDRRLTGEVPPEWRDPDPEPVRWLREAAAEAATSSRVDLRVVDAAVWSGRVAAAALDELERQLVDALTPLVRARAAELGDHRTDDPFDVAQAAVRDERRRVVAGRHDGLAAVAAALDPAVVGPTVVVLSGPSGVGKTTVWQAALDGAAAAGRPVVSVMVAVGPASTSAAEVVARLADALGLDRPVDVDGDTLVEWWHRAHQDVPSDTVIGIDGLDRLAAGPDRQRVTALLRVPAAGARFLVSTADDAQSALLRTRGARVLALGPLTPVEVGAAVAGWAAQSGRTLPDAAVDVLAAGARSGLWARLAVEELAWLDVDDYTAAEALERAGLPAEEALTHIVTAAARRLPETDGRLVDRQVDRAADVLGAAAPTGLGALALTRSGLAPADLAAVAGVPVLTFARARWQLGSQLVVRDDAGRLAPDHEVVRRALLGRIDPADREQLHRHLARRLDAGDSAATDPTDVLDQVWHALHGADADLLAQALARVDRARRTRPALDREYPGLVVDAVTADRAHADRPVLATLLTLLAFGDGTDATAMGVGRVLSEDGCGRLHPDHEFGPLADGLLALARRSAGPADDLGGSHRVIVALTLVEGFASRAGDVDRAESLAAELLDLARRQSARHPDHPVVVGDLAVALDTVSRRAEIRGDLPRVRSHGVESAMLLATLVRRDPATPKHRHDLVVALLGVAGLANGADDPVEALRFASLGVEQASLLHEESPGSAEIRRMLAAALWALGRVLTSNGDVEGARTAWTRATTHLRELAEAAPDDRTPAVALAFLLRESATLELDDGDRTRAREMLDEVVALHRGVGAQLSPDDPRARGQLAAVLLELGVVATMDGDLVRADALLREGVAIDRARVAAEPGDLDARRDLANALGTLGRTVLRRGDTAAGLAALDECCGMYRRLVDTAAQDPRSASGLAEALVERARALAQGGDHAAAVAAVTESRARYRKASGRYPDALDLRVGLASTLDLLATLALHAGDLVGARAAAEERLAVVRRTVEHRPGRADLRNELADALVDTARIVRQHGDPDTARARLTEALDICRTRLGHHPADTLAALHAAAGLMQLAALAQAEGDIPATATAASEAVAVCDRALRTAPGDPRIVEAQADAWSLTGWAVRRTGDLAAAEKAFVESLALARRLEVVAPRRPDLLRRARLAHDEIARTRAWAGDWAGAREPLRAALDLAREVATTMGRDSRSLHDLLMSEISLGEVLRQLGDETWQDLMATAGERLLDALPTNPQLRTMVAELVGVIEAEVGGSGRRRRLRVVVRRLRRIVP